MELPGFDTIDQFLQASDKYLRWVDVWVIDMC